MWRLVAARATGASHLRSGLPCQDRCAYAATEAGAVVAALADGAGSAANAERGAEIAVDTVVRHVCAALANGWSDLEVLLREAALMARDAVAAEASGQDTDARSYASTLLALVLTPEGGAALQIGDGLIIVSDGNGGWCWVFWPQHGEYVNTTYFLTDEDVEDHFQVDALPGRITDFALTSDGLEALVLHYASSTLHEPFFTAMFRPLTAAQSEGELSQLSAALERFLASDPVMSRTSDDVSLILATGRDAAPPP